MARKRLRINYRKIYESYHGAIPVDTFGRSFDIHHIDRNPNNNDPKNLIALSIEEHYDVHKKHNDLSACILIAERMSLSPEEIAEKQSKLAIENNKKMFKDGKHPFQDKELARKRVLKQLEDGKHPFTDTIGQRNRQLKKVSDGSHHLLGGEIQRKVLAEGRHPSQVQWTCPDCQKTVKGKGNRTMHINKHCDKIFSA